MVLENTQRYYVAMGGGHLIKEMPPLKGKHEVRRIAIQKNEGVCPCNDMDEARMSINYEWYERETQKLVFGVL
jgi:hypothetical protein